MYATLCKTTSDVDIMHDIGIALGGAIATQSLAHFPDTRELSFTKTVHQSFDPTSYYIHICILCVHCIVMKSNHIEATCSNLHFQRGRGEVRIPSPGPSAAFAARAGRLPRCVRATMGKAAAASAAAAERYC